MKKTCLKFSLFAASAIACSSAALAQTDTGAAVSVPAALPPSNYSLDSSTLKTPQTSDPPVTASPYALSGTSISGSSSGVNTILTAAVPTNGAAYKTESGIYLYPTAFIGVGSNSNMLLTPTNPVSSNFINLAPRLTAELKHKGDRYTAVAVLDQTTFSSSSPDNRTNAELALAGDNYFTARARAGWAVGYVGGTDDRGSYSRPVSNEPDKWHSASLNGRLIYGAEEAKGRVEVDLGHQAKTYDNNRVYTVLDDLTMDSVAGRFFYRLGGRSLALVEVRNAQASYASALATTGNNTERRFYMGLTWDATAASAGLLKVGRMTKNFDDGSRDNYSGSSWEASVRWLPRSYSVFELQTARSTAESTGVGTYDVNATLSLSWKHNWTQSLSSTAAISRLDRSYGSSNRTDSANTYSLAVDYAVLRWLKMGIDLTGTNYSSSDPTAEYKRNIMMFTLNASL